MKRFLLLTIISFCTIGIFAEEPISLFKKHKNVSIITVDGLYNPYLDIAIVEPNQNVIADFQNIIGRKLVVQSFEGESFTSSIDWVNQNINGTITIRSRLDEYPMAYMLVSCTDGFFLGTINIPEKNEQYSIKTSVKTGITYFKKLDITNLGILEGSEPLIPDNLLRQTKSINNDKSNKGPDDPATIDVMIVYTPAAMNWAIEFGGGIANVVAQAVATGQLAMDNSDTNITINLVHSDIVDYEEVDAYTDLENLTVDGTGYMDIVHVWRDQYCADIVSLFTLEHNTGGLGWLLDDKDGWDYIAFNLVRVQQGHGTTFIHEAGHNMGCHHHKEQNVQAGPTIWWNWPENEWSAGWRWLGDDSQMYVDLMTYSRGEYFADGIDAITYVGFSNPNVNFQGQPTGHAVDGDNARTLKEIKHIVADYRSACAAIPVTCPENFIACFTGAPIPLLGAAPGGGIYSGDGVNIGVFYPAIAGEGTHIIDYEFNGDNCTFEITVILPPDAGELSGPIEICLDQSANYNSSISDGTWSSTNPAIAGINSVTGELTALSVGVTTIQYTIDGVHDCHGVSSINVQVLPLPNSNMAGNDFAICLGDNAQLNASTLLPVLPEMPNDYCGSIYNSSEYIWISEVSFGTIHNISGPSEGYSDFTDMSTELFRGETYTLSYTVSKLDNYGSYVRAFIDWNSNGIFETIEGYDLGAGNDNPLIGSMEITVPEDAAFGTTKMRIILNNAHYPSACFSGAFGETEDYTIIVHPNPNELSYSWNNETILNNANIHNPLATLTETTTFTLTTTYIGCSNTDNISVFVIETPEDINNVCFDDSPFELEGATPEGGTYSGDAVTDGIFNPALGNSVNTISYEYLGQQCTYTINVHPLPIVNCPVNFTVTSDGIISLSGATPEGGAYSGTGVSDVEFNPEGLENDDYIITYTYIDPDTGCENFCEFTITVDITDPIEVICPEDMDLCVDDAPFALTEATPEGGTYSGDGVSEGIFDPAFGSSVSIITYEYDGQECTFTINVHPLPIVNCPEDFTVINDEIISLSGATPAGGAYSGTGVSDGEFNPEGLDNDDYIITYTYIDLDTGCENICEFTITVDIEVGIIENMDSYISLYPNPNNGIFELSLTNIFDKSQIEIFDSKGRVIHIVELNDSRDNIIIELSPEISPGLYFLRLVSSSQTFTKKLIIR